MHKRMIGGAAALLAMGLVLAAIPAWAQTPAAFDGHWTFGVSRGMAINGSQLDLVSAMRAADLGQAQGSSSGLAGYPISNTSGHATQVSIGREMAPRFELRLLFEKSDGTNVTGSDGAGADPLDTTSTYLRMTVHSTSVALLPLGDLTRYIQFGGGPELALVSVQRRDGAGDTNESSVSPGLVAHLSARGSFRQLASIHISVEQHLTAPVDAGPYNVHRANGGITTVVPTTTIHVYHTSVTFGGSVRVP